jgi:succinate-acetate transporter protein
MSESGHTDATGPVPFAEPTPMGLICLAVACAALFPAAFGSSLTPVGLRTASMFCLLFGAGGQFLAGMLSLANRNLFGGTLFTAFAFNWVMNWWTFQQLAAGVVPDHGVVTAVDGCFLVIFVAMTYGFGFASKLLFFFLLDIDLIYVCRLVDALTGTQALVLPLAVFLVGLAALSLWIAFALLLNPVSGRELFPMGGPMYAPRRPSA